MTRQSVATRLASAVRAIGLAAAAVVPFAAAGCSQTASAGTMSGTRLGAAQLETSSSRRSPSPPPESERPALELLDRHESFAFN
ncbi:MAG TPA: hypothetical protein VNN80_12690, partial [Polyangiaceae bacterium]|nr:hypothetical protein [Polyangiaceae bacterium]